MCKSGCHGCPALHRRTGLLAPHDNHSLAKGHRFCPYLASNHLLCGWSAHKSLGPRTRTLLGVLGQATLNFVAVGTVLFFFFCGCPKFCDLAKQRRKIFWGVSEVGKIDLALYFFWLCVFFLVFFSSAASARRKKSIWITLRTFQSNCYRALVTTLMQLKLLTDPDVRLYMLSDDDDPNIFNRRLTDCANGGFDFDDIAEFHILWAKHRDWHENANAVSMRYEAYTAYRADFDLQVSMGRRPLMAMVVYHMPTIMQPSKEMWPDDGNIPMEEEEDSDWVNISPHSFQKGRRTRLFGDVETQQTQTQKRLKHTASHHRRSGY